MTPLQVRGSLLSREPDRAQHQGAEFYVGSPAATPGVLSDRGACRKSRRRTPVIKAPLPQVRDLHLPRWGARLQRRDPLGGAGRGRLPDTQRPFLQPEPRPPPPVSAPPRAGDCASVPGVKRPWNSATTTSYTCRWAPLPARRSARATGTSSRGAAGRMRDNLEDRCHRCGGEDRRATAGGIARCRDQSFSPRRDGREIREVRM